ncbi:MAG: hypothetical protein IT201_03830 [Thermoleophilia bacterium]|nr:hypothetical protein [Thermoleophilia bacterium]
MRRAGAAVALGASVLAIGAANAWAFKIDPGRTAIPLVHAHVGDSGIHESVTHLAILIAHQEEREFTPPRAFIKDVQTGAENADVTHQFDSEQHFDNATVANGGFELGFALVHGYFDQAVKLAQGNDEFREPSFTSFRDIAKEVESALARVVVSPKCILRRQCPTAAFYARAGLVKAYADTVLLLNPNPDPHVPTNPGSLFASPRNGPCTVPLLCRAAPAISKASRTAITEVEEAVDWSLGKHSGKTLAQLLGQDHTLVKRLERARDAIRAYRAFQLAGHALHAAQDFFAHSNYVELMAGVPVGQPIASTGMVPEDLPVPASAADFGLAGLRTLMGDERYARLESGGVAADWLGEGDYCLGDRVLSVFNPAQKIEFRLPRLSALALGLPGLLVEPKQVSIPLGGTNPGPPPGLSYCHYVTSTTAGLNKDEPGTGEPSHANHEFAAKVAERVSVLLWRDFISRATAYCPAPGRHLNGDGCELPPEQPPSDLCVPTGEPATAPEGTLLETCTLDPRVVEPYDPVYGSVVLLPTRSYRLVVSGVVAEVHLDDVSSYWEADALYCLDSPGWESYCGDAGELFRGWPAGGALGVYWGNGFGGYGNPAPFWAVDGTTGGVPPASPTPPPYSEANVYAVTIGGVAGQIAFLQQTHANVGSFVVELWTAGEGPADTRPARARALP